MPEAEILEQRLAENPLPARAFAMMTELELRRLRFHDAAVAERKRRLDRRNAKLNGDEEALRATALRPVGGKERESELREAIARLFAA